MKSARALIAICALFAITSAQLVVVDPEVVYGASSAASVATAAFQQDRDGYRLVREVEISTQYSDAWNYYNGMTYGVPYTQYHTIGDFMYAGDVGGAEFRSLLRFDGLSSRIPVGSTVVEATLVVQITTWTSLPATVSGKYLNRTWNWDQSTFPLNDPNKIVGWRFSAPGVSWSTPGALGDTVANKSFRFNVLTSGASVREVPLDPEVVQSWLNDTTNYGVILYGDLNHTLSITSLTTNNTDWKPFSPMLVVTYTPPPLSAPLGSNASAVPPLPSSSPLLNAVRDGNAVNRTIFADSVSGLDTNNGHSLFPVKTLVAAVALARPGDVILLRDGIYGGADITLPDITISSAPGHWAVISAPMYNPFRFVTLYIRDTAHRFVLRNVEVTGGYYNAVGTGTTWENYNIGPGRELNGSAAENVLIENCRLHSSGSSVVKLAIAVKNATLRNNLIHSSGRRSATYGHGIEMVNTRGGNILGNHIYDVVGAGVKMSGGCKNVSVSRNMIERAYLAGILMGFYEETEYMDWVTNPKWFECRGCKAVSNIIFNVQGAGVGLFASENSLVLHNTMYSVTHSLMAGIRLIAVQHWVNASYTPVTGNVNPRIHNNIIVKGSLGRPGNMMFQLSETTSYSNGVRYFALEPNTTLASSSNVYSALSGPTPSVFSFGQGVMFGDEFTSDFMANLSGWQAAHPEWEQGSLDRNPALSRHFAPTACSNISVPTVTTSFALPQDAAPLLDFDGREITPDAFGNVFAGARQVVEALDVADSADDRFPRIGLAAAAHAPYSGPGVPPQSTIQWPYHEMESHIPRVFVVAPDGLDNDATHNGTEAFPYRTSDHAQLKMWPGDTLYFREGTYRRTLNIWLPNVTFSSYPGEHAVINVSTSDSSVSNAVYFAGKDWNNFGGSGEVTLRNLEIVGGYYYGIMFNQAGGGDSNGYWNWWKQMHHIVTPSLTIVENCSIHHTGSHVIKVSPEANRIVFRRLDIHHSGKRGDVPPPPPANPGEAQQNAETPPTPPAGITPVQGNGFDVRNGNSLVIEDCHIHDITGVGILLGGGAQGCTVQRNFIHDVSSIGIMIGSFNTEAQYMRLVENPNLFQAQDTMVRNNVVVNADGAGLGLYSTSGTVAVHNTFYNVARTMHASLLFNIAPNYYNNQLQLLPSNENCVIANNIFHQSTDAVGYMLENRIWTSATSQVEPASYPGDSTCSDIAARQSPIGRSEPTTVPRTSGLGGGCPILPPSHPLNTPIDQYPVHPLSETVMLRLQSPGCRCIGGDLQNCFTAGAPSCGFLHPDFGGTLLAENGEPVLSGFPINYVNGTTPKKMIPFGLYPDESDNVPFPFPPDARIEGTPDRCPIDVCSGDRHVIAFDTDTCTLYETWKTQFNGSSWLAANGAVFDLTSDAYRPLGWTSADAAGLPIMPGLVRFDEVQRGEINHAIRVTFAFTRKAYVLPATHYAAPKNVDYLPAMGHRFRLKSTFDCSTLQRSAAVICRALQVYGAIVADNGANWFLSGEAHPDWNVSELDDIKRIPAHMMELVYTGDECITSDCHPVPPAPVYLTSSAFVDLSTLYMSGNVYYRDAGAYATPTTEFVDRDPVHFWRSILSDLSAWQNHSGADQFSVLGDPRLTAGMRLGSGSAGRFSSPSVAALAGNEDYFGRTRPVNSDNSTVDAGAIAFYADDVSIVLRDAGLPPDPAAIFVDPCAGTVPNGTTVYVARNGSDASCSGSLQAPFATIAAATRRVVNGGTIALFPGTYTEGGIVIGRSGVTLTSLVAGSPARIRSTPQAGSDTITIVAPDVILENLEIVGGYTAAIAVRGRNARIRRCSVHGAGQSCIWVQNRGDVATVENCVIRNCGQRVPRFGDGVLVDGAAQWVSVLNNTFRSVRSTAIHVRQGAAYVTVSANFILNAQRGISIGNDNANYQPLPDFYDYTPIIHNDCRPWQSVATNPTCFEVMHATVVANVVHNTEDFAIGLAGTKNVTVAHNTVRRGANAKHAPLYLTAVQHFLDASSSPMVSNVDVVIVGNIFTTRFETYRPMVFWKSAQDWGGGSNVVPAVDTATALVDHNLYFKEANTTSVAALPYPDIYYRRHSGAAPSRTGAYFHDDSASGGIKTVAFASWKASHPGVDASSLEADPQFNASFPIVLLPTSPALGAVAALAPLLADAFGVSLSGTSDLGALQSPSFDAAVARILTEASQAALTLPISPPMSCIPPETAVATKPCDGVDCWHPWLAGAAPSGLSLATLMNTCLHGDSMFPVSSQSVGRDISSDRVHPLSDAYKTTMFASRLHPDWGTTYSGVPMGIPYAVVRGSKYNTSRVRFTYTGESDDGPYVIPSDAPVEGGSCEVNGDRHILVLDVETCKVHELFKAVHLDAEYRSWLGVGLSADSGVVFDLRSTAYRPLGYTSGDAAGLSVFAGLVFKEEIDAGVIRHAVRFTVQKSQMAYYYPPATHFASNSRQGDLPPMGLRARLKPWYNCSQYNSRDFSVVCNAMKTYGLILADNGGNWFVSGSSDSRWNDASVQLLANIPTSAIDIVDTGATLCTSTDCRS